jgi:LAO/AO transport system kinase
MNDISSLMKRIALGENQTIARAISLIENEADGYEALLKSLRVNEIPTIGITGPPGAGKSTLVDLLISNLKAQAPDERIAVLCIDPSSPFSHGALLGDRVRMNTWPNDERVFIRSLATRGSLGGLHPKIIEVTELLKAAPFDFIIIETVGVGQNETGIANFADITVVVLVPESGDDIQVMKAGLMEIADIFVVNKSDRPDADKFIMNLETRNHYPAANPVPIIKTIATEKKGIDELLSAIKDRLKLNPQRMIRLLAERAYGIIMHKKMGAISKKNLEGEIEKALKSGSFNLYRFVEDYF